MAAGQFVRAYAAAYEAGVLFRRLRADEADELRQRELEAAIEMVSEVTDCIRDAQLGDTVMALPSVMRWLMTVRRFYIERMADLGFDRIEAKTLQEQAYQRGLDWGQGRADRHPLVEEVPAPSEPEEPCGDEQPATMSGVPTRRAGLVLVGAAHGVEALNSCTANIRSATKVRKQKNSPRRLEPGERAGIIGDMVMLLRELTDSQLLEERRRLLLTPRVLRPHD